MKKIKYVFKMIENINKETEKKKIQIIFDIVLCKIKYKASLTDYDYFEMYKMTAFECDTIVTKGKNEEYIKKYNNSKYTKYINNALEFHKTFTKFLNRNWLELENVKEFKAFCNNHQSIVAYTMKDYKPIETKNINLEKIYKELKEKKFLFVEEQVFISSSLKKIAPSANMKIKIITLLGKVLASFLYIEEENTFFVPIDIETGEITTALIDENKNVYEKYPKTNKKITNLKVPNFERLKEICELASLETPSVGYIEWNLKTEDKKCFLMSASSNPNHNLYQRPPHRHSNIGYIPIFKKIEERKIEE